MYYRKAAIVVAGYDVTAKESLYTCKTVAEGVMEREKRCLVVVVGNKIDLPRVVSREEAISFFEGCGVPSDHYFETSAKTGEGVEKFLEGTLRLWYEANKDHLNDFIAEPVPGNSTSKSRSSDVDKKKSDAHCIIC